MIDNILESPSTDDRIHALQTEVAYLRRDLDEEKRLTSELTANIVKIAEELRMQRSVIARCAELATSTEKKVRMWPFVLTK